MHASVLQAKEYRDRENGRRQHNLRKRQAHGLVRAFGLNPAITPAHPDGTHAVRRKASHQERLERRWYRFFRGMVAVAAQ